MSCHVCHPSLANDNLAGIAVAISLAQQLAETQPHYTYRFLFMPGTIGSITWLARNAERIDKVKHGLVLACAGDPGSVDVQASPGAATPRSTGWCSTCCSVARPHQRHRLLAVRLRRAPVLLARASTSASAR